MGSAALQYTCDEMAAGNATVHHIGGMHHSPWCILAKHAILSKCGNSVHLSCNYMPFYGDTVLPVYHKMHSFEICAAFHGFEIAKKTVKWDSQISVLGLINMVVYMDWVVVSHSQPFLAQLGLNPSDAPDPAADLKAFESAFHLLDQSMDDSERVLANSLLTGLSSYIHCGTCPQLARSWNLELSAELRARRSWWHCIYVLLYFSVGLTPWCVLYI